MTVIFDNNHTTTENVNEIAKALTILTGLKHLHINLYGNKLGDEFSIALGSSLTGLTNLEGLHFELGINDLTSTGV